MSGNRIFAGWSRLVFVVMVVIIAVSVVASEQMRISSVNVTGNVSISRTKILSVVRARSDEVFDAAAAAEDARRIGQIDGVKLAYYNTEIIDEQVKLTFVVTEKNLIRSITFTGNEHFSVGKLSKEIGIRKGDYLDEFIVRNGIELITTLYRKDGYAFVTAAVDDESLKRGRVSCKITEGPRVKVKKVSFEGNKGLSEKKLRRVVKTKTRKFFFWPAYYNPEQLSDDVDKLSAVFQKKGFLDTSVESKVQFESDNTRAYITFVVHQGPVYNVEQIVITGNEFFTEEEITGDFRLKLDDYYSSAKGDYDRRKILGKYMEKGFLDARVEHKRSFDKPGSVTTKFDIIEGDRFKIGQIDITGNEATHDKVIRCILDEEGFHPAEWFNGNIARGDGTGELEKIIKRQAMTESAFIKAVGNTPGLRDAQVNIIEGQTGSIMVGAGVASDSGLIGMMTFDQRNFDIGDWPENFSEIFSGKAFKGAGQRLRISAEPGTEQSRFFFCFSEPYLYNKPVSLDVVASSFGRFQECYDEDRLKAYFGFEKRYRNKWRRGVSFRAENVEVTDIDSDAPKEIKDVKGNNDLFGARLYIRKDTTDSRFLPSRGYNFDAGYEQVGGDHTYGILSATQRWYKTLYEDLAERRTILETKLHAATIAGGDAPPFEKFYAGGTHSIRGFDYRGVSTRGWTTAGTRRKKDPIGSDWIMLANAEISVPLDNEVFSLLFFTDAGLIDSGGVRASIGTGLQILIPQWFGPVPMRFELATPLVKEADDDRRVFSFSVGALF